MSNSIAPGSSADVNVKVTALTTNPNVPVTYKTIILKKNLVNGVNTLTQEMMSATNTKYVIKYDYVLNEDITVPENCVLEFDGGSISGAYTITGQNTGINAEVIKIINTDVMPAGTWKADFFYPEWFGATGNSSVNEAISIQRAIDFAKDNEGMNVVRFMNNYRSDNPIFLKGKNVTIDGNNTTITFQYRYLGGRIGFVIGQAVEGNYDVYIDKINNGEEVYWGNPNFINPPIARENIDQYIYDGSSYLQAKNCWIHDITIDFNYTTYSSGWGGYAINFANTLDCGCYNIISYHAHEAINIGSDVSPETPGNVGTRVWNIEAKEPSLNCYYAIGFICNSKHVILNDCRSIIKIEGTVNESHCNLAIAYSDHVNINNIVSELLDGSTETGTRQGLEVNGSTNCVISNVYLKGWRAGLSIYTMKNTFRTSNNYFNNVILVNNNVGISLSDKDCFFNNIKCVNNTYDLLFVNINATSNNFQNHNITKISGYQTGGITSAFQCLVTLNNSLYPKQKYVIPISAYLNSKYGQTLNIRQDTYGYTQFLDTDSFELRISFNNGRICHICMSMLINMTMAGADGNFGIKVLNCNFAFNGYPSYSEVFNRTITGITGQDADKNIDANVENLGDKSDYLIIITGLNVKTYSVLRSLSVDVIKSDFKFTLL